MNYLDDIIVTGRNHEEYLCNLSLLLGRLERVGLKANITKCEFFQPKVYFLGHVLDASGISPNTKYIEAVRDIPVPSNIKQLQSFLGKVNYYGKFIPSYATLAAPLNALRKKGVRFVWSDKVQRAFNDLKKALQQATHLSHFDARRSIILDADASEYGIGAVLSQRDSTGSEYPIAYASKTLNKFQSNYS